MKNSLNSVGTCLKVVDTRRPNVDRNCGYCQGADIVMKARQISPTPQGFSSGEVRRHKFPPTRFWKFDF